MSGIIQSLIASYPPPSSVWNGLVAYYKLDSNSNDSVGTNNGTDTSVSYVTGKISNAGSYNGTSSRSFINSALGINGGAMSISCWIKMNAEISSGVGRIVYNSNSGTDVLNGIYYDFNSGTRRLAFDRTKDGVGSNTVFHTITLGTTNWYHLVLSYNGTTIEGYVNGTSIGTIGSTGNGVNAGTQSVTTIGDLYYGASPSHMQFINATIDEVGIWNRGLIASDATTLYNSGSGITY